ncbi:hypothetical protein [Kaistia soli]|uniref:hypothetical protein n=1 Tax=Kaistia soli TaxID=446684 RepID=UPI0009330E1F|nr:hypothetical protein [Kaistia soli]
MADMIEEIFYILAIPSWEPIRVSPFQGFAPGLFHIAPYLVSVPAFPSDISELAMDPADRLARRRAGQGAWHWSPVTIENLLDHGQPTPSRPFMVVITSEPEMARRVATWRRGLRVRPLHLSAHRIGGAIRPHELTVERLQQHCRTALRQAKEANRWLDITERLSMIDAWRPWEMKPSGLHHHSHNVTLPNEMVLRSAGFITEGEDGRLEGSPEQDYVDGITESASAVFSLHEQANDRPIYLLNPPRPDLILLAPSMHVQAAELIGRAQLPKLSMRAFRALKRQRGYTIQLPVQDEQSINEIGPIFGLRGGELRITTYAVGVRATSTAAATIRLPALINRSAGVVGQLARFLRHHENPPPIKTARVFRAVQNALSETMPPDYMDLLRQSNTGIKIIGEAPLEWLPLGDLPLGIARDVSRIGTTPGNLLIEQLRHVPPLYIPADEFKKYLVVSMFEEGDGIAHHVRRALEVLPGAAEAKLTGISAAPKSTDEFVSVVNGYSGPILIVDSHGTHADNPDVGGLNIGGKFVDVWGLAGHLRPPPIVILSACDTHPFDRSHATVANGFLRCGAIAVLGTVLPIRSRDAAIFLVRLMLRAISFGNAMNANGRSVAWTNIVGGALRMQLASDIVRSLGAQGLLPKEHVADIHRAANYDINPPNERTDWLPRLKERCIETRGFNQSQWTAAYTGILAGSDVIRYVNIGNPEAILISDERVLKRTMHDAQMQA